MNEKKPSTTNFPPLSRCAKNRFSFSVACPSFVYRAGYQDNVRHLAPFVDEIQLLFFESHPPESLPDQPLIRDLAELRETLSIDFNVHLPSDLSTGSPDSAERRHAAEILKKVIAACEPLAPTTYTLHLSPNPDDAPDDNTWQKWQTETILRVLEAGVDSRRISVETLDYSLERAAGVIENLNLSICMDMGHLMVHGFSLMDFFRRWEDRITIVHLHGVDGTNDHLPLNRLNQGQMDSVTTILDRFSGTVTLEVYSYPALNASISHLMEDRFGVIKK